MGTLIAVGVFAGFMILLVIGRWAMLREAEKRVAEWARSNNFVLNRCEMTLGVWANRRPVWRIRITTTSGECREGWAKGGWSIYEPIEVEWAKPGSSAFR